jgi:hypothetical protein
VSISPRWENACGKLPSSWRDCGSYSSANNPTPFRTASRRSKIVRASAWRPCSARITREPECADQKGTLAGWQTVHIRMNSSLSRPQQTAAHMALASCHAIPTSGVRHAKHQAITMPRITKPQSRAHGTAELSDTARLGRRCAGRWSLRLRLCRLHLVVSTVSYSSHRAILARHALHGAEVAMHKTFDPKIRRLAATIDVFNGLTVIGGCGGHSAEIAIPE